MMHSIQIQFRCAGLAFATVFSFFMAMACGGGGSGTTTSAEEPAATPVTIAISGTVSGTASANVSIQKNFLRKGVSGANLTVTCNTLDGTSLGAASTGADGTFTIDADLDFLKPADATGSSYQADIICSAKNSDGAVDFKTVYMVTVEEGTTTAVSVGTIDTVSTIAAAALGGELGCNLEIGSKCTKPTGMNLQCARMGLGGAWAQANAVTETGNIAYLAGTLKRGIENLFNAGTNWASMSCNLPATCIKQFSDCTLSDGDLASALSYISTVAPETVSQDFNTNKSGWMEACTAAKTVHNITTTSLAGSSDAATTCANLITGGADYAKVLLQPLLAVATEDVTEPDLDLIFNPKAFNVIGATMNMAGFAKVSGSGPFMLNLLADHFDAKGVFDDLLASDATIKYFATTAADAAEMRSAGLMSATQMKEYSTGSYKAFEESGIDIICPSGECEEQVIRFVTTPFAQENFDKNTYNFGTSKDMFGTLLNAPDDDKASLLSCHSIASPVERGSCFMGLWGGNNNGGENNGNNVEGNNNNNNNNNNNVEVDNSPEAVFDSLDCDGVSGFSFTQAQNEFSNCNDGNALRNLYQAINSFGESGCMSLFAIELHANLYGITLCGNNDPEPDPEPDTCGNLQCDGTEATFGAPDYCPQDCVVEEEESPLAGYWDGQWYSSDIGCIAGPSFVSGVSAGSRIDPPAGQSDSGTCAIYNASNVAATGCGYAGAGLGSTVANSAVISITGWAGPSGSCNATLTRILPAPPPANPTDDYWNGTWVHTQDLPTYTCESDTITIANRSWEVAPATFITFSKPISFMSADIGTLTLPGDFTVGFTYGRPTNDAVASVESGTFIVIPALNTPDGICSMRLVKQ